MIRKAIEIYYDDECGEVFEIKTAKFFAKENVLLRLDVLQDAIEEIQSCYDQCIQDEYPQYLESIQKNVSRGDV